MLSYREYYTRAELFSQPLYMGEVRIYKGFDDISKGFGACKMTSILHAFYYFILIHIGSGANQGAEWQRWEENRYKTTFTG